MKNNMLWKGFLFAGILPFVIPVVLGLYRMRIESWTMMDWLVLYSFLYWPTYLLGFGLILGAICIKPGKKEKAHESDCKVNG